MSPRTRQQNERVREDRRRQVLQAATALFSRNGFDGTSTAAVAKSANVSHGTVFFYYPTKAELYQAAVLEPLGPTTDLVRGILSGPGNPRERIEQFARLMLSSFAREEAYLMLLQQVIRMKDRFGDLYGELMAFTRTVTELLGHAIAEGQQAGLFLDGDPVRLACYFLAFINGVGFMFHEESEPLRTGEDIRTALRLIMR